MDNVQKFVILAIHHRHKPSELITLVHVLSVFILCVQRHLKIRAECSSGSIKCIYQDLGYIDVYDIVLEVTSLLINYFNFCATINSTEVVRSLAWA
jgi:hypothetical protein